MALFIIVAALLLPAHAHDSCCAAAAAAVGGGSAAVEWIPDPDAKMPSGWDEEEDGPWERPLIKKPPPSSFEVFAKELKNSFVDVSPWLLLGLLLAGAMQGLSPSQAFVARHLAGNGAVAKGATLGLLSPLCSCGALPMATSLAGAGASAPAVVAYVVAAQSAGVDSLLFTLGVLGATAATARMAAAAIVALAAGLAMPRSKGCAIELKEGFNIKEKETVWQRAAKGMWEAGTTTFDEVAPPVMVGFAATSAITAFMPSLAVVMRNGDFVGRAAVLLAALPLQFCEHAAVPLALALQGAGASGGLAFASLATVPGLNLASLGVIRQLSGFNGAVRAAMGVWLAGLVGSYAADAVGLKVERVGHGGSELPEWYEAASLWVMGAVAAGAVLRFGWRRLGRRSAGCASEGCCK